MIPEDSDDQQSFLHRLVRFSLLLRSEGLTVTPTESIDMTAAVSLVGVADAGLFREVLRITLVKRSEDYPRFQYLFEKFWLTPTNAALHPAGSINIPRYELPKNSDIQDSSTRENAIPASNDLFRDQASGEGSSAARYAVYSPLETHSRKSFAELDAISDRLLLSRNVKRFARATATLPGRRHEISRGREVDFRRTLRNNLKTGGDGVEIKFRSKKIAKARIVVLADISGSMDAYGESILKLLYRVSNTLSGSSIFGFSTRVVPLNPYLQGKSLREAMRLISKNVDVWSSGTRIGASLRELFVRYSGVLRSSTVFVVISDGWELGDLELFRKELEKIHRQVSEVVWLNPQADGVDYQPLAQGMKIALPYADMFAGLGVFSNKQRLDAALKNRRGIRHAIVTR